jgi:Concanavalin A-like lectin/glucanases superfamily
MNKSISIAYITFCSFIVILLLFSFTINDERRTKYSFLDNFESFAQTQDENNSSPIIMSSKVIEFTGNNYGEIVNSSNINLNSFTISLWFKTSMNVTGEVDGAFLINKGGLGTDLPGINLNYGMWLNNREQLSGGFEAINGDDFFITSQDSYANGKWHNAILTFDNDQNLLKLYIDGVEVATNSTRIGIPPDTIGRDSIRLGANAFANKGEINGKFTGALDDINIWNYAFTKEQVIQLFNTESKVQR